MAKLTEELLKQAIAKGEFSPVYCLYGSETYLIAHYATTISQKTVEKGLPDFNFNRIEGDTATLSQILEAAESLPVMHSHRCVLVRDFPATAASDKELADLMQYLTDPCPSTVLIFYYTGLQPAATGKWKTFLTGFEKAGFSLKLTQKTGQELVRILVTGAGKRGCRMSSAAANYLIECVGNDLNTLLTEMEKLTAYRLNQEITTADIDRLCSKSLSVTAFQMVREISRKNSGAALKTLKDLFDNREEPLKILGALSSSYVNLYRALTAQEENRPLEAFGKELAMKKPANLQYSLKDARSLGGNKIDRSLTLLCQQDVKLKSLPVDGKLLVEQAVVALLEIAKE